MQEFKKLSYDEILDILKEYSEVESFCDENYFITMPEDFKFSEEVQKKLDLHKKYKSEWELNGKTYKSENSFYKQMSAHPKPYEEMFNEAMDHLGLGKVIEVDSYGGEDCGSTYYSIKHFVDHDVYIKVSGWYQSHYGTDFGSWDDACSEVKPQEKIITVYE